VVTEVTTPRRMMRVIPAGRGGFSDHVPVSLRRHKSLFFAQTSKKSLPSAVPAIRYNVLTGSPPQHDSTIG
jgi:hypothetical protein